MLNEMESKLSLELFEGLNKAGYVVVEENASLSPSTNETIDCLLTIKTEGNDLISFEEKWLAIQHVGYLAGFVALPVKSARVQQKVVGRDIVADVLFVKESVITNLDERLGAYYDALFTRYSRQSDSILFDMMMKAQAIQLESEILVKEIRSLNHSEAYRYHVESDSAARRYVQLKDAFYEVKAAAEQLEAGSQNGRLAQMMFG